MCKEFGTAFLQGSVESLMAPVQMILHPVATVEGIYEAFCKIPNLPEIIEQKWEEFSNLSEEERYVAIARGLGGALSNRFGVKLPVGGLGKNVGLAVQKVAGGIDKMNDFLSKTKFGQTLKSISDTTNRKIQGQKVFKVIAKNELGLKKGDRFYLDGREKNHIEVFNYQGKFKRVINLDGTINETKTKLGINRKIDI